MKGICASEPLTPESSFATDHLQREAGTLTSITPPWQGKEGSESAGRS